LNVAALRKFVAEGISHVGGGVLGRKHPDDVKSLTDVRERLRYGVKRSGFVAKFRKEKRTEEHYDAVRVVEWMLWRGAKAADIAEHFGWSRRASYTTQLFAELFYWKDDEDAAFTWKEYKRKRHAHYQDSGPHPHELMELEDRPKELKKRYPEFYRQVYETPDDDDSSTSEIKRE
jgi:hypothetical protein